MKISILLAVYSVFFLLLFIQRFVFNGRGSKRDAIFNKSMYGLLSVSAFAVFYGGFIQILLLVGSYIVGCFIVDYIVYILYKYIIFKKRNGRVPEYLNYRLFQIRSDLIEGKKNFGIMNKTMENAKLLSESGMLDEFLISRHVNKDYLAITIPRLMASGHIYLAVALLQSTKLLDIFINKEREGQDFQEICFECFEYIGMP
jgi:hypothetical protein